jgi:hypothetical protein
MPSKDALKNVLNMLKQERSESSLIKGKQLRGKFVLNFCIGVSDDDTE